MVIHIRIYMYGPPLPRILLRDPRGTRLRGPNARRGSNRRPAGAGATSTITMIIIIITIAISIANVIIYFHHCRYV